MACKICEQQKKNPIACRKHCMVCHRSVHTIGYNHKNVCYECRDDITREYLNNMEGN